MAKCEHVYGCCNGMDGYVTLIDDPDVDIEELEGSKGEEWFDFCPKCGRKLDHSKTEIKHEYSINLCRLEHLVYPIVCSSKLVESIDDKRIRKLSKSITERVYFECLDFMNRRIENYEYECTDQHIAHPSLDDCEFAVDYNDEGIACSDNKLIFTSSVMIAKQVFNDDSILHEFVNACVVEFYDTFIDYGEYVFEFEEDVYCIRTFLENNEFSIRIMNSICYLCEQWDLAHFSLFDYVEDHHKYMHNVGIDVDGMSSSFEHTGELFYYSI